MASNAAAQSTISERFMVHPLKCYLNENAAPHLVTKCFEAYAMRIIAFLKQLKVNPDTVFERYFDHFPDRGLLSLPLARPLALP